MSEGTTVSTRSRIEGYGKGEWGPTWNDVRRTAQLLEEEYGVRLQFVIDPGQVGMRYAGNLMHIRVRAYHRDAGDFDGHWAASSMGGNAGTKTMPAAMYLALLNMQEILDGQSAGSNDPSEEPLPF
jgi:hypothetical protein